MSEHKTDGWQNLLTGYGVSGIDKRMSTEFVGAQRLTESIQTGMFTGDGFAQRIITLPADDMVREWFKVAGDTDGLILDALKALQAKVCITKALRWARLYGGSVVIMGIDDGGELTQPLNENNIRNVDFLRVYDRYRVSRYKQYMTPESPKYGQIEQYMVSPCSGTPYYVHESRALIFDGIDVPDSVRLNNDGWGDSVLQAIYPRIRGLGEAYGNIETIISEFIIGKLTIKNLGELLATGQESLVHSRLSQIDLSKHVINSILLDESETFDRISATVSGLEKLMEILVQACSAVTGIPVTLLMGESPAGLQATGASDIRLYYDAIAADQETALLPSIEKLVKYIMLSKDGPTGGKEIDGWAIEFNSLWQQTEKELAETRKITAETDGIYITNGVLLPEEVAASRFGGNKYSAETELMVERAMPTIEGGENA